MKRVVDLKSPRNSSRNSQLKRNDENPIVYQWTSDKAKYTHLRETTGGILTLNMNKIIRRKKYFTAVQITLSRVRKFAKGKGIDLPLPSVRVMRIVEHPEPQEEVSVDLSLGVMPVWSISYDGHVVPDEFLRAIMRLVEDPFSLKDDKHLEEFTMELMTHMSDGEPRDG